MFNFHRNSGIHTFELRCSLCREEYLAIRENLYFLSRETHSRFFCKNNCCKCNIYSDYGISILLNPNFIKLTINPSRLREPDDLIGLYSPGQCNISPTELSRLLSPFLKTFLPETISSCLYISRIDYTIDSLLPSDEHVLLMIKLAKKNGLPRGFEETYTAKIRNSPDFNDKFSYDVTHSSGTYQVTLYAKHKQLFTRKNIPQDMLDGTEGLLRAEISCFYPKETIPLWQNEELENLFDSQRLISTYQTIIPKLFPYGVYLKSPLAKKIIEKQYKNQRTLKKHLLKFLDNIITRHSFHNGYKLLKSKNIPKKILLESFYSAGVNPVTISVNDNIKYLPSIYTVLGLDNLYDTIESDLIINLKSN